MMRGKHSIADVLNCGFHVVLPLRARCQAARSVGLHCNTGLWVPAGRQPTFLAVVDEFARGRLKIQIDHNARTIDVRASACSVTQTQNRIEMP